jgi:hypothetical protein
MTEIKDRIIQVTIRKEDMEEVPALVVAEEE